MPLLPRLVGRLTGALLLRRLARDLQAISRHLEAQNALLTRLADRFAPAPPLLNRAALDADSGVSHLDATEAGLAMAYIAKTQAATGHVPDEEEVLVYLADEKTHDLALRLTEREAEMVRLAADRAWGR